MTNHDLDACHNVTEGHSSLASFSFLTFYFFPDEELFICAPSSATTSQCPADYEEELLL